LEIRNPLLTEMMGQKFTSWYTQYFTSCYQAVFHQKSFLHKWQWLYFLLFVAFLNISLNYSLW